MIKLNTIYGPKNHYYILIIRNPKTKCYELYRSIWLSNLQDLDYLLKWCDPIFASGNLSDVRYYARKVLDGEEYD